MKKVISLLFTAVVMLILSSCNASCSLDKRDEGPQITRVVKAHSFDSVSADIVGDIYFKQSDTLGIRIEGPKEEVERIKVEFKGNALVFSTETKLSSFLNGIGKNDGVKVYISSPNLVAVSVKGVTDFHANKVDTDNMLIDLSGVGGAYIDNLVCDNFDTEVKGTGDVEVKSLEAITAKIFLHGTGDVKASCHKVKDTVLSLQGTGDIDVNMDNCGKVNANLQGTGDITIKGNVSVLEKSEHGTGDIDTDELSVKAKN